MARQGPAQGDPERQGQAGRHASRGWFIAADSFRLVGSRRPARIVQGIGRAVQGRWRAGRSIGSNNGPADRSITGRRSDDHDPGGSPADARPHSLLAAGPWLAGDPPPRSPRRRLSAAQAAELRRPVATRSSAASGAGSRRWPTGSGPRARRPRPARSRPSRPRPPRPTARRGSCPWPRSSRPRPRGWRTSRSAGAAAGGAEREAIRAEAARALFELAGRAARGPVAVVRLRRRVPPGRDRPPARPRRGPPAPRLRPPRGGLGHALRRRDAGPGVRSRTRPTAGSRATGSRTSHGASCPGPGARTAGSPPPRPTPSAATGPAAGRSPPSTSRSTPTSRSTRRSPSAASSKRSTSCSSP